jgi:hypothetical protein
VFDERIFNALALKALFKETEELLGGETPLFCFVVLAGAHPASVRLMHASVDDEARQGEHCVRSAARQG